MKTRMIATVLIVLSLFALTYEPVVCGASSSSEADEAILSAQGIVDRAKTNIGGGNDGYLVDGKLLGLAGTSSGDWYVVGSARFGIIDNFIDYLSVLNDYVDKCYERSDKLDKAKSTEWHRITLAVLACGGNPRRAGTDGDIDLVADGVYNRIDDSGNGVLGRQGINGFIWGLIALDGMCYGVPSDAYYTRDDIILNILSRALPDGGWTLYGTQPDPDMTAMAVQALAPYYNSEKVYDVRRNGVEEPTKVRQAVRRALAVLSDMQRSDGNFVGDSGRATCESTSQVLAAVCALGKNPFETSEFVTDEGKTAYDGLIAYRTADGGFSHSKAHEADNSTAISEKSDDMASQQALCGLTALVRLLQGKRRLYDFRPEQSEELKTQIADVSAQIDKLTYTSAPTEIQAVYDSYLDIDPTERSYVYNYEHLSELLAFHGISYVEEPTDYSRDDVDDTTPMYEFTDVDKAATDSLPDKLTMQYKQQVLTLFAKIRNCFDFDGKNAYLDKLTAAKSQIDALSQEIDDIKRLIKAELYPFDQVSLANKKTVDELYARYIALSEYDRTLFEQSDVEGLVKAKTQVDNLQTALIISVCAGVAVVAAVATIVVHMRKRKKKKIARQMPESEE